MVELAKILGQLLVVWFSHLIKKKEEQQKAREKMVELHKEADEAFKKGKDNVRSSVTSLFTRLNNRK